MEQPASQVIKEATKSEAYWNLSDAEKLIWMIERAFQLGAASASQRHRRQARHRSNTYRKD